MKVEHSMIHWNIQMNFTETEAWSNRSYTRFDIQKTERVRHLAIQLWDELISTWQKNSELQYVATLGGRERVIHSRQKFAVLSTRSPCLYAASKTFLQSKIFLLSICRSKDCRGKGKYYWQPIRLYHKKFFYKVPATIIIENTWI